jgi:uncharacterized protein (TIGR02466 family)
MKDVAIKNPDVIVRNLFATPVYQAELNDSDLITRLVAMARMLSRDDRAGVAWSRDHGYRGYTSYASLNDLPKRDPDADDLKRALDKHALAFAKACAFDLSSRPKLDSLWVNILKPGGTHSGHIHPHSIISGTIYIDVPKGAGGLRFEDPRLPMMMAAPLRHGEAPEALQQFVTVAPHAGMILMWESWLRHEVEPNGAKSDRISISFNYA